LKKTHETLSAADILQALTEGAAIQLEHCRITGPLDLNALNAANTSEAQDQPPETDVSSYPYVFSQKLHFNACVFEEDVVFSGPWQHPDQVRVVFEDEVLFNSSEFLGQTRFSYAQFQKSAGFDGCTFARVCAFRNVIFEGLTLFRTTTFEGYALFNGARFGGDTRFTNTCFGKGVNFTDVTFGYLCDFGGVFARNKSVPHYENVVFSRKSFGDDASFWRFIKQVCQEAGHYQQAGECFYRERCAHFWHRFRGFNYDKLTARRKAVRWLLGIRFLPEFVFGRLLFGYGERPTRVLGTGAVIIFLCGLFYSSPAAHLAFQYGMETPHRSDHLNFLEGLYYSTVTFTTVGFGDIYPAADTLTRLVTMFESLAGVCLTALFVISLAKRFSRG
jgi:hypothetical protein